MKALQKFSLALAVAAALSSYSLLAVPMGHPTQVQSAHSTHPEFVSSRPDKPRRRLDTMGKTHRRNLRASKRGGKTCKQRKQA